MDSVADLNARADAVAAIYAQVALLTSDALDGTNVAAGGAAQTVTYTAGGAAGPLDEHVPIDGAAWSGINTFTLTEVATHMGLLVGGVVYRTQQLRDPVGPGSVPFVHAVGPAVALA